MRARGGRPRAAARRCRTRPAPATTGAAQLQRTVGNAAVARLLAAGGGRQQVQRSAIGNVQGVVAGVRDPEATWTVGLDVEVSASDPVGHAWIDVRQDFGKRLGTTVGFWPSGFVSGLIPIENGSMLSPDPHEGGQQHRLAQQVGRERMIALLNTVNDWAGTSYNLLFRNCADFARAAYFSATANQDAIIEEDILWTPLQEASLIDEANRARGKDELGRDKKP